METTIEEKAVNTVDIQVSPSTGEAITIYKQVCRIKSDIMQLINKHKFFETLPAFAGDISNNLTDLLCNLDVLIGEFIQAELGEGEI